MANTIKIRRGSKKDLPQLSIGELAYCTDTKEIFIGTSEGNQVLGKEEEIQYTHINFTSSMQSEPVDINFSKENLSKATIWINGNLGVKDGKIYDDNVIYDYSTWPFVYAVGDAVSGEYVNLVYGNSGPHAKNTIFDEGIFDQNGAFSVTVAVPKEERTYEGEFSDMGIEDSYLDFTQEKLELMNVWIDGELIIEQGKVLPGITKYSVSSMWNVFLISEIEETGGLLEFRIGGADANKIIDDHFLERDFNLRIELPDEKVYKSEYSNKIIELNNQYAIKIWIGTEAQYNSETNNGEDPEPNVLYYIKD